MALTYVKASGIDSTGSYTVSSISATANVSAGNIIGAYYGNGYNLSSIYGSNVLGQVGNSLIAGTIYSNAQPNITSVGTLASLTVSGLVTATSGGVKVGNIIDSGGTNTISVNSSTVGIVGSLNVGTGGSGNVTATYFIGNGSQITGLPASYSNTNVAAYLPTYTGLSGAVLTTGAQPNVTSVGTLSGLTASGVVNLISSSNVSLGPVGNIHISGGSSGQVLTTDGAGTLSWANASGGGGGGLTLTDDTSTNSSSYYPLLSYNTTSGTLSAANTASSKFYFNPSTGTLNSTLFNSLSDETIKTNKQKIVNALSKLALLGGYTYLLIDSNEPSAGLLAQEVEKVLPEAVKYNPDTGLLTLNYNAVLGLVVEAINELEQRVSGLEKNA